ncbi:MAG: PP2C family protein-serine/threonine phosphatase [Lachnospiraceae bacterium]|nr:PP2C family protein-serine/threonine phosphatase [Lachnospiraceae bacterium]
METQKPKKRQTIADQIARPMILFIAILILVNAIFLFLYALSHSIQDRFKRARQLGETAASELEDYECLSFLISYWREHYDTMELFYDNPELFDRKEKQLSEKITDTLELRLVTNEEAAALDEEGQRLLAEVCYNRLSDTFDFLKRVFHPIYLTCFSREEDQVFFYVTGTLENEYRISEGGKVFELGSTGEYKEGVYPILDDILKTGQPSKRLELSLTRGADSKVVHYFFPVYSHREMVAIVGVSLPWKDLIRNAVNPSIGILLASVLLLVMVGLRSSSLIRRLVAVPLMKESQIIETYKKDKDGTAAAKALEEIDCGNELELIADNVSSMVQELDRYVEEIRVNTTEKERLNAELALAASIQEDMLPDTFPAFPDRTDFDIYASMTPAKEVGGDFYDFFLIDEDHLGLVMADVSGKGIPAALFMMRSTMMIQNCVRSGMSPAQTLHTVNEKICETNSEKMFFTIWLGVLDLKTGKIRAANAGHEYPILCRAGGSFELYKDKHSFVVGGIKGIKYHEYDLVIEPGSRLFLYTDGVPEAVNAAEKMFGTARTVEALNSVPDGTPEMLLEAVDRAVRDFVEDAPQFDDLTMMCLHYIGKEC